MGADLGADLALTRARLGPEGLRGDRRRDAPLAETAVEFETVLLRQLVSAMRETSSITGESQDNQLTGYLIEDALATHLARSGGIGLAELVVRDAEGPPAPSSRDAGLSSIVGSPIPPATTGDDQPHPIAPTPSPAPHYHHDPAPAPPAPPEPPRAPTPIPEASAPAGRLPLASRLPPQGDAWLGGSEARAYLRRSIGASPAETSKDD